MIADLVGALNNLKQAHTIMTYRSVLFPAPAIKMNKLLARKALVCGLKDIRLP